MNLLRRLSVIVALISTVAGSTYGQSGRFRVKGVLIDSIRNENLEFATAALTKKGEETPSKYALTNEKGVFEIPGVEAGEYTMRIEFMGYTPVVKEIKVGERRVLDVGNISMLEEVNLLDQVLVTAYGNPVTVKKDTIEYNAAAFHTTDSDMLEALLKKLPGIEIDSDGKITANGKEIRQIMVDGKTFFLDDPTIATKNLPASIINKVRVVDRKSEQARFTGIDDGKEETILDLSIKPGMMNGWFGNGSAGYGTRDRYQVNGLAANFTEKRQLTVIGNANNTNNRGFGDMARGMRGSGAIGGGFGRVRFGGTTVNIGGSGITSSWMGGANGHTEFKDGAIKLGGNLNAGGTSNVAEGLSSRQNFLPNDSTFFNRDTSNSKSFSEQYGAGLEFEWEFSESAALTFRPRFNFGNNSSTSERQYSTTGGHGTKINDGNSTTKENGEQRGLGGDLFYRQRLGKPGRTISIFLNYNISENDSRGHNYSETNVYGNNPFSEKIDQTYYQDNNSYSGSLRASYTEPLGANHFLEAAYAYNMNLSNSKKHAHNYNPLTGEYDIEDLEYSNVYENTFINQNVDVNIRKNEERYSYNVGFSVQPSYTSSYYKEAGDEQSEAKDVAQTVVNFSPSAGFDFRFTDSKNIRLDYRGSTRQPSIEQLQPVRDNKDPLFIQEGNPDLLPEFNHNLSLEYRTTQRATFSTFSIRASATYTQDKIVNMTTFDDGGVRTTKPVNEDGTYSFNTFIMYGTPILKSNFHLFNNLRGSFNNGVNYTNGMRNLTKSVSISDMLRLSYRGESLFLTLSGRASYQHAWYSIETSLKTGTWQNNVGFDINWNLPGGFSLSSDIYHNFYIGYEEGMNDPTTVWNGQFSKLLFKGSSTLTFAAYDILNQANTLRRDITDNYILETQNNTLQRYFMFTFTYRFGTFGSGASRRGTGRGMSRGGMGRGMMFM